MVSSMKKCLLPLLAALLTLVGCVGDKVSYKGFSFEYPDAYKLQKTVSSDGMRCTLQKPGRQDLYLLEAVPDVRAAWDLEEAGNEEMGKMMANSVYDLYNRYFNTGKELVLDEEFEIESSDDDDFSPYAYADLEGTIDGTPFKAIISSDLWGEIQVTTLILAYSEESYREMFQQIFGSYSWVAR